MSSTTASWNRARDGGLARPPEWLLDCSFAEENAAGFALGALDSDEQQRFLHHIAWCPACARLLHETRKAVEYLPFVSPKAAPPSSAKAGLFARISAEREDVAIAAAPATEHGPIGLYDDLLRRPLDDQMASDIAPSKRSASKRRFSWEVAAAPLAAVPLVFALAIVGGFALQTQNRLNDTQARLNGLRVAYEQAVEDRDNADSANVTLMASTPITLATANAKAGDSMGGELLVGSDRQTVRLTVRSLPLNVEGFTVYLETPGGNSVPVKDFRAEADGGATIDFELGAPLDQFSSIHIAPATRGSSSDQIVRPPDLLWRSLDGNLGDFTGTEANLIGD